MYPIGKPLTSYIMPIYQKSKKVASRVLFCILDLWSYISNFSRLCQFSKIIWPIHVVWTLMDTYLLRLTISPLCERTYKICQKSGLEATFLFRNGPDNFIVTIKCCIIRLQFILDNCCFDLMGYIGSRSQVQARTGFILHNLGNFFDFWP